MPNVGDVSGDAEIALLAVVTVEAKLYVRSVREDLLIEHLPGLSGQRPNGLDDAKCRACREARRLSLRQGCVDIDSLRAKELPTSHPTAV